MLSCDELGFGPISCILLEIGLAFSDAESIPFLGVFVFIFDFIMGALAGVINIASGGLLK